jgi:hypothetical protein
VIRVLIASRSLACVACVFALAGCKGDPPPPAPAPARTAAAAPPAVDRVDPEEVPEGAEKAFGLPIPRAMSVDARFPDAVRAHGRVPLDAMANYVRARVVAERVETGPAKTVFSRATLKASPEKMLRVEVVAFGDRTEMIVRDVTRPPSADVVKPTDPWNKPGFDPKDRRADPGRFE